MNTINNLTASQRFAMERCTLLDAFEMWVTHDWASYGLVRTALKQLAECGLLPRRDADAFSNFVDDHVRPMLSARSARRSEFVLFMQRSTRTQLMAIEDSVLHAVRPTSLALL